MLSFSFLHIINSKSHWWKSGSIIVLFFLLYEINVMFFSVDRVLFEQNNVCLRQEGHVQCFLKKQREHFFGNSFLFSTPINTVKLFHWKNHTFLFFPNKESVFENKQLRLKNSFWIFTTTSFDSILKYPLPKAVFNITGKTLPKKIREFFIENKIPLIQQKDIGNFLLEFEGDQFFIREKTV